MLQFAALPTRCSVLVEPSCAFVFGVSLQNPRTYSRKVMVPELWQDTCTAFLATLRGVPLSRELHLIEHEGPESLAVYADSSK